MRLGTERNSVFSLLLQGVGRQETLGGRGSHLPLRAVESDNQDWLMIGPET